MIDLSHASEIHRIGNLRKGDILVATDENGIWTLQVTEASLSPTGKQITIAARGEEDAPAGRRWWKSTHRSSTTIAGALGGWVHAYRKEASK